MDDALDETGGLGVRRLHGEETVVHDQEVALHDPHAGQVAHGEAAAQEGLIFHYGEGDDGGMWCRAGTAPEDVNSHDLMEVHHALLPSPRKKSDFWGS